MLNWLRSTQTKVTDFNVGSIVRTMLESVAIEIEELYLRMFIGLREAIPVSVYNTFGFASLPAAKASGTLRFTAPSAAVSPIIVHSGSAAQVPGKTLTYVTLSDATIAIGQTYVDVLAAADTAGTIGNTGTGTVTQIVGSIVGISSVSNNAPIINGLDQETDDDRLNRFRSYISTLARGTVASVLYGANSASLKDSLGQVYEYVALSALKEPWLTDSTQPVGLVLVYIHNGASATSSALVTQAQNVINGYYQSDGTPVQGWKAAGVKVVVAAASDYPVNVTGTIQINSNYPTSPTIAAAAAAIALYIQRLTVGASVLKSELTAILKRDIAGITNVHITLPVDDLPISINAKAIPGTITLTAA